jgi:hypothetical protein
MIVRYVYLAAIRRRLRRFRGDARRARGLQHRVLLEKIRRHANSDFGRNHGFSDIQSVADFRRRLPIASYEDHLPYITRVLEGDLTALFAPGTRVLMFAMTSGTTGKPKRLPITAELFDEYRAGWRMWGAGVYGDHIDLMQKKTLQLSSDWQQYQTPSGVPCGQISGLAASTRPCIANRMFLPPAAVTRIHDAAAKHYTSLRIALASERIGMMITANPSTLVEFAHRADCDRESLIRDICDGTLSCEVPPEVRSAISRQVHARQPGRARQLERIVEQHGTLLPRHAWPHLSVLAVWMGGSVRVYLPQLERLYGGVAIRDHGLSASEGRMTIPLADGTAAGLLDFYHHYFEFIPVEEHGQANPTVLEAHELEEGKDYFIVLTTSGGLYRYDIHDIVRCVGYEGQAPLIEFLSKGKSFSSLTGEKLSEHQVVESVEQSFAELRLPSDTFTVAPRMDAQDRPHYVLVVEPQVHQGRADDFARHVQAHLERRNEEYESKCRSGRLLPLRIHEVPAGTWDALRHKQTCERGNFEEFKHPCLVGDLGFVDYLAEIRPHSEQHAARVS